MTQNQRFGSETDCFGSGFRFHKVSAPAPAPTPEPPTPSGCTFLLIMLVKLKNWRHVQYFPIGVPFPLAAARQKLYTVENIAIFLNKKIIFPSIIYELN
jgi:hypothetical protein